MTTPVATAPAELSLAELVDHILDRYHAPLRTDLPRLIELAERVERDHAGAPGCPAGLAEHLRQIEAAVESHLAKEEQILFPLIKAGRGAMAHMPVRVMMLEHDDHHEALARLRELASGYVLPEGACGSWRALYEGLSMLDQDLQAHIALENDVLFPRALAGE